MSGPPGAMRVERERVLLVEGADEVNFVVALMGHHFDGAAAAAVQVIPVGGRTRFRERLRAVTMAAERLPLRAIGVMRDADADAHAAWRSARDAMASVGLQAPDEHAGVSDGPPGVGIFIAPDGGTPGALETLCIRSVAGTAAGGCVEGYLACLEQERALHSTNRDKSFAHAWLASCRDPVARVGEAARQGAWNFDHPAFAPLVRFVQRLVTVNP